MKTLSKLRFILLLVLCAVSGKGWAEGDVIFSEDFSGLTGVNGNLTLYGEWTLNNCASMIRLDANGDNTGKYALKVGTASDTGSATTPTIPNMPNAAELLIYYAKGQNTSGLTSFTILLSSGRFSETGTNSTTIETNSYYRQNSTLHIIGADEELTVTFTKNNPGKQFALSGVYINPLPTLTLYATSTDSNAEPLTANAGKLANVTIGRTFPANTWCTLCLPFDVTTEMVREACNQTEDPKLRVFSSVEDQTLKFTAPSNGTVSAGTPFLLNLATAVTSSPVFSNVTISKTDNDVTPAATITFDGFSFTGTYSPKEIDTDETTADLFLNSSGQFCRPTTEGGKILAGLRAYITVPVSVASGARMKLSIENDDKATGIETLTISPSHDGTLYTPGIGVNSTATVYTLTGHTAAKRTAKGISIVRSQDGRVRKTVTK